jgi:hypothetical protein
MIQTKLAISSPGDPYEQEADRVADTVMRMPTPTKNAEKKTHSAGALVQRRVSEGESGLAEAPPIVDEALRSAGQPLDADSRAFFEKRFGHDFSQVRVHTNSNAAESARVVGASAYTVGSNVLFAKGWYRPQTAEGRQLLAHELTHVLQQSGTKGGPVTQGAEPVQNQTRGNILQRQLADTKKRMIVLSLDEIKKDARREQLRKQSGQTEAKVCRSVGKEADKQNCPTKLEPGTEVNLVAPKVGGLWLKIENTGFPGFGPKEETHILAAFAKEKPVPVPAKPKPALAAPPKEEEEESVSGKARKRLRGLSKKVRWIPPKGHPHGRTMTAINLVITAKDFYFTEPFDTELAQTILDRVQRNFTNAYLTDSNFDKAFGHMSGLARTDLRMMMIMGRSAVKSIIAKIRIGQITAGRAGGEATWQHHLNQFIAAHEVMEVLAGDLNVKEARNISALEVASSGKAVSAFIEGLLAGLKSQLSDEDYKALSKKLAGSQVLSAVAPPIILGGAGVGLAKDIWEALKGIYEILTEPLEMAKNMATLIGTILFDEEGARVLGEAVGEQHSTKLHKLAAEDIITFTYKLGELVGPTVVYSVLSIVTAGVVGGAAVSVRLAKFLERYPKAAKRLERIKELLPKKKATKAVGAPRAPVAKVKHLPDGEASKLRQLGRDPRNVRPVSDKALLTEGYELEIPVGRYTYRRHKNGTWCRFGSKECGFELAPEDEAAILKAARMQYAIAAGWAIEDYVLRMNYTRPKPFNFRGIDGWKRGQYRTIKGVEVIRNADVVQVKAMRNLSHSNVTRRYNEGIEGLLSDPWEASGTRVVAPKSRELHMLFDQGTYSKLGIGQQDELRKLIRQLSSIKQNPPVTVKWFYFSEQGIPILIE